MTFYYVVFVVVVFLSQGTRKTESMRFYGIGVILFAIAAFRGGGIDNDYQGYLEYFDGVVFSDFSNVEPSFSLISKAVNYSFGSPLFLFFVYAFLGILIKWIAIDGLTKLKSVTGFFYYCSIFFLWEMTQIRVAVSGAILLFSIQAIKNRCLIKFLALCLLAFFFHYSSLIMIPLYFINGRSIKPIFYYGILPLAIILIPKNFSFVNYLGYIPIDLIALKIENYSSYGDGRENIFNYLFIMRCVFANFMLFNANILAKKNEYFIILLKVYFFSLFLYVVLSFSPSIASRLSELLLIVEVILVPFIIYLFRDRVVGYFFVIVIGLCFMMFSLHHTMLLNPYYVNQAIYPG